MRYSWKIIMAVLILIGVLFLLLKFFNLGPLAVPEVCPPDQCTFSKNGQPIFAREPGRIHEDFLPNLPPGFPTNLPIDPKPVRIFQSYKETIEGDKNKSEPAHTQLIYAYLTQKPAFSTTTGLEKYLKNNQYTIMSGQKEERTSTLSGQKTSGQLTQSITVSITTQNQFEWLVTISMVTAESILNLP